MGTIYLSKVDEWEPPGIHDDGKHRFLLLANVTVTDTTIVANNAYLKSTVFGHDEVWLDRVSMIYGGTAGVLLETIIATGLKPANYLPVPVAVDVTTTANDEFLVHPLDPPVPLEPRALSLVTTSAVNFLIITQSGATATDTLYVLFEGWYR